MPAVKTQPLFISKKYFRLYNTIIDNARALQTSRRMSNNYHEEHHIIPLSLGGTEEESNIIILTQKEHYLCHYLLTKFTEGEQYKKMVLAFAFSNVSSGNQTRSHFSRILYTKNKVRHSAVVSGASNPMYGKKRPEHSIHMTGSSNPFYGKKHSRSTKSKIALANAGKLKGDLNPSAKKWLLTSPEDDVYFIHGDLDKFCALKNISRVTLKKNEGCIVAHNRYARGDAFKNTIGWCLKENNETTTD